MLPPRMKMMQQEGGGVCLVWEELTVVVGSSSSTTTSSGTKRKVISEISGYAEPNRIMALIGPSGAGKSTLLDALAGRLPTNVTMTGNVLLNGTKRSTSSRDISYVTQEDYFLGTLTVRETLTYAAHLRLPSNMTKDEIDKVVAKTIAEMGLQDCADSRLGNWHSRGISKGEKRRLSISLEILTQPHILLLDEPTSGLDGAAAFFVITSLRSIAHDGRIVICSIHQLSSEVFNLFDDVVLLAGGETVYFGERTKAVKFFADAGFPCPTRKNPPEHFLRCVNPEFDTFPTLVQPNNEAKSSRNSLMNMTTEEIKWKLIKNYKNSMHSANARKRIREIKQNKEPLIEREYDTSRVKQLCTLTHRSFLNMTRDIGYYWLRILFFMLVSICAGFLYFNIGTGNDAILSRGKCDGFIYGFMIVLCIGGLPFFVEELKQLGTDPDAALMRLSCSRFSSIPQLQFAAVSAVTTTAILWLQQVFKRERFGRHYGEAVYVISSFISSFPFVLAISLTSGTTLYHMVNFHPGFSHYCYFCINLFCSISVAEGCMLVVAALVSNLLLAMGTATGVAVLMVMPSNVFRRVTDIPKFFWRYPMSYISYTAWSIEGQFKNDLIGLEFEPLMPGDTKIRGEVILHDIFGIRTDYSKWWDIGALVLLLICYRLLFFMVLKHKDRASSSLLHTRKTIIDFLLRKPSLNNNDKYISSKRHHSLYPLSSQEGLSSPIS